MQRRTFFIVAIALSLLHSIEARADSFEDMFHAVRMNDVAEVRQLLRRGMDPNATDQRGDTILITAIREGSVEVARLFLTVNVNVNARNAIG